MALSVHSEQEAFIREYLAAVSNGATGEALARFYTPDAIQDEFPNRLIPQGARRDLAGILEAAERGKAIVSTQSFEILHALWSEHEQQAALELQWQATFKIPLGSLAAGEVMRARFAVFIQFKDGRIHRQRNYDCFEAW